MQILGLAKKVTIYIDESDKWQRQPLYMAILEMLKKENCAGATVTRGIAGFGAHSRIHTTSLVALSADLPLMIEWVDSPARVKRVMPQLQKMVTEGLITVQDVEVMTYSHRALRELPHNVLVHDVMSREVMTVQAETPLAEAITLLFDKVYRALPVVDAAYRLEGILTEGDLLTKAKLLATTIQQALSKSELDDALQSLRQSGQTVGDLMTPKPITVRAEMTIPQAVKLMTEHQIKRLPVVDDDNRLVGIISRVDVLRALSQPVIFEIPRQDPPPGHHLTVGEVMITQVPTVQTTAPLAEIVGLLVSSVRRRVVVVDEAQRVVGIITDGDLINRATTDERSGIIHSLSQRLPLGREAKFRLSQRTASEVMTKPVVAVMPETPLLDGLQLLLHHRIKRLPVVNELGQLVGLVGRATILQALAADTKAMN